MHGILAEVNVWMQRVTAAKFINPILTAKYNWEEFIPSTQLGNRDDAAGTFLFLK